MKFFALKGSVRERALGFLYDPATGSFLMNKVRGRALADAELRALARHGELTFTAVPPGSGVRIGLDRNLDGILDGDERASDDDQNDDD